MHILFNALDSDPELWMTEFRNEFPHVQCRVWQEGDDEPADYAVVWKPQLAMLAERRNMKAVFNIGAGVDAIMKFGDALPEGVPIVRLDDAGMGVQMAEYVTHAVLRYFRRFDEYAMQARDGQWRFLQPHEKRDFTIGILGLGVLGSRITDALKQFDFPLRAWSRSVKKLPGVERFSGDDDLDEFLRGSRVLVCVLPLTDETTGILNHTRLAILPRGSYVINVARGAHVVEADLLALVKQGHIAGATLDVFREEPLPPLHPFWQEPKITLTPHMAALTLRGETVRQIAGKIRALERGEAIAGVVDRTKGY